MVGSNEGHPWRASVMIPLLYLDLRERKKEKRDEVERMYIGR